MGNPYWEEAKEEIQKWESSGPGFLAQVGDAILWPVQKAAEMLIPKAVQEMVGKALIGFLEGLSKASAWTVSADAVRRRVAARRKACHHGLKASDEAAKHYWAWNVSYAIAEGGVTGVTGLPGLVADIPALFTICLRCIQQIAHCYGYDTSEDLEREYVMHILRTGSTGDIKAKMEFLIGLKQVEQVLLKVTWKKMNEALARKEISRLSLLAAIRQFAKTLGIQITKRKALQMVPAVGGLVGASFNGTFVNDVGRAAYMSYRRRFIDEHKGKRPAH